MSTTTSMMFGRRVRTIFKFLKQKNFRTHLWRCLYLLLPLPGWQQKNVADNFFEKLPALEKKRKVDKLQVLCGVACWVLLNLRSAQHTVKTLLKNLAGRNKQFGTSYCCFRAQNITAWNQKNNKNHKMTKATQKWWFFWTLKHITDETRTDIKKIALLCFRYTN